MKEVLVTGGNGLVGSHFVESFRESNYHLLTPRVEELDLALPREVEAFFQEFKPEVAVHFAAFTDVNASEKQRGQENRQAWIVNVLGTENLVAACIKHSCDLIHLSTDGVFSGSQDDPGPYSENHPLEGNLDRLSWYGWTKNQAEEKVNQHGRAMIVRISNPTRAKYSDKLDYIRKILWLYDQGKLYPLFTDQYLTLTFINEVSEVISRLVKEPQPGIYHVSSRDRFTPHGLAEYLLKKAREKEGVVQKGSLAAYLEKASSARYPQDGGLNTQKTQKRLKIKFRSWQEIIDALVEEGIDLTQSADKG